MVITGGDDDGVDGRVVVAPGDILLPFKRTCTTRSSSTIEAGRITDIGGTASRRSSCASTWPISTTRMRTGSRTSGGGSTSEPSGRPSRTDQRGHGMELRAFCGNVLFSTGPNELFGGPNHTACHLDIPMRNCSLFLDERPIIVDGEIVVDAMRPGPATVGV